MVSQVSSPAAFLDADLRQHFKVNKNEKFYGEKKCSRI